MPSTLREICALSETLKAQGNWDAALEILRLKVVISTRAGIDAMQPIYSVMGVRLDEAIKYSFNESFWRRFGADFGVQFEADA